MFSLLACLLILAVSAAEVSASAQREAALTPIGRLLDQGDGETALRLLQPILSRNPKNAEALLARSTAHFLVGDLDAGAKDLDRALELDRTLRQGWLNLGALKMSRGDTEGALAAFEKARDLDPNDKENALNIGAALLLLGRTDAAAQEFALYLDAVDDLAQANLLIAKNYALANEFERATQHASAAIAMDERLRLAMRTDPAFADALDDPGFQAVLASDQYRAPAGSLSASRTFETPYDNQNPVMAGAVIDALNALSIPFDPRVEATANWALIWMKDLRLKISPNTLQSSTVTLIAPPRSQTRKSWQELQDSIFGQIVFELAPKIPDLSRPKF